MIRTDSNERNENKWKPSATTTKINANQSLDSSWKSCQNIDKHLNEECSPTIGDLLGDDHTFHYDSHRNLNDKRNKSRRSHHRRRRSHPLSKHQQTLVATGQHSNFQLSNLIEPNHALTFHSNFYSQQNSCPRSLNYNFYHYPSEMPVYCTCPMIDHYSSFISPNSFCSSFDYYYPFGSSRVSS